MDSDKEKDGDKTIVTPQSRNVPSTYHTVIFIKENKL